MTVVAVASHRTAQFDAVHHRHHPVAHNERNFVTRQFVKRLLAVDSRHHLVVGVEVARDELKHLLVIVDNQHHGTRHIVDTPVDCARTALILGGRHNVVAGRGSHSFLPERQGDDECRAVAERRLNLYLTLVSLDHTLHDAQSKSGAALRLSVVIHHLEEGLEYLLLIVTTDSHTVVRYRYGEPSLPLIGVTGNDNAILHVLARVV